MLRIVPLGGLGEIGLNSMAVECGDELMLVDAGLLFSDGVHPGVGVVVPDFSFVRERAPNLKGVVLTHAHEDHLGALPYLLRDLRVPVYGSPLALRLLSGKLAEREVEADLRPIGPRMPLQLGEAFAVTPLQVAHSTPEALGLVIRTPAGTVVHTGDFKLDPTPIDGRPTDLEGFAEAGSRGVTCLLSDSTNAEVPGRTPSEQVVKDTFYELLSSTRSRVIFTLFASNLHRLQHIFDSCAALGRKVALVGRSLSRNVELARELGTLRVPTGVLLTPEEASMVGPHQLVLLATGSQAEPRSGLWLLLRDDAGPLRLERGDLVVFSARPIPGNERAIDQLINALYAKGADVLTARRAPGVHVSGHGAQDEQRQMLSVVKPANFLPIHGELRHLRAHLQLARELGLPESALLPARDGDVVSFEGGRGRISGTVPVGRLMLDSSRKGELSVEAAQQRGAFLESGVVVVAVAIDRGRRAIVSGPTLTGAGLASDDALLVGRAGGEVRGYFEELSPALWGDEQRVKEELVRAVRRVFKQHLNKRAAVVPAVVWL